MTRISREKALREEAELIQQLKESIFYSLTSIFKTRDPESIKELFNTAQLLLNKQPHILSIKQEEKLQQDPTTYLVILLGNNSIAIIQLLQGRSFNLTNFTQQWFTIIQKTLRPGNPDISTNDFMPPIPVEAWGSPSWILTKETNGDIMIKKGHFKGNHLGKQFFGATFVEDKLSRTN